MICTIIVPRAIDVMVGRRPENVHQCTMLRRLITMRSQLINETPVRNSMARTTVVVASVLALGLP